MEPWIKSAGGAGYKLLKTGQTTQYSSELDDGYYQKGQAKSYTVLNTGQYSGSVNIDLAHYTGTDIGFVNGSPDTITSTVLNFTTLFVAADKLVISGGVNDGVVVDIAAGGVAANTLTLVQSGSLTTEAAGSSRTLSKREAHTNVCALDNNTKLIWTRDLSTKMGAASFGAMPWTGEVYDIFAYCAAANTASLAGWTDWRVPNRTEVDSITDSEAGSGMPDATAFPSMNTGNQWTSTTRPDNTSQALTIGHFGNTRTQATKTSGLRLHLVRGP